MKTKILHMGTLNITAYIACHYIFPSTILASVFIHIEAPIYLLAYIIDFKLQRSRDNINHACTDWL